MSVLNSLFDVVRGAGPLDENVIDESLPQHASITAGNELKEGEIVFLDATGTWDRATSVDLAAAGSIALLAGLLADAQHMWLVVSGVEADQYDGLKQGYQGTDFTYVPWKVTAIRGPLVFETEQFVTGRAYVPGDALSVDTGKIDRTADFGAGRRQYGEVFSYDSAREVLTVVTT